MQCCSERAAPDVDVFGMLPNEFPKHVRETTEGGIIDRHGCMPRITVSPQIRIDNVAADPDSLRKVRLFYVEYIFYPILYA